MQTVLLDGTTVVAAHRLLAGAAPPTALNVTALALLVEAIILHEQIITLETSGRLDFDNAAATFGYAIRVERNSVRSILDRYISIEFPEFFRSLAEHPEDLDALKRRGPSTKSETRLYSEITRASDHIFDVLHSGYYGSESDDYLALLTKARDRAWSEASEAQDSQRSRIRRLAEASGLRQVAEVRGLSQIVDVADLIGWALRGFPGHSVTTEFDGHYAGHEIQESWHYFVGRYTNTTSAWAEKEMYQGLEWSHFLPSLLIRTHFYLMASAVYDAPYRPDLFRGPISYKFFEKSEADIGIDERLVDLAEEASSTRLEALHKRLGRRPFALLPLFLGSVLATASEPSQVVARAYEIRNSPPAQRFRKHVASLAGAETNGDIERLTKDFDRASAALQNAYGTQGLPADVAWGLAGAGLKAGFFPSPAAGLDLGLTAGKASMMAGISAVAWWQRRKLALITRAAKRSYTAGDLQHQLLKVFKNRMSAEDLAFLDQVSAFK